MKRGSLFDELNYDGKERERAESGYFKSLRENEKVKISTKLKIICQNFINL